MGHKLRRGDVSLPESLGRRGAGEEDGMATAASRRDEGTFDLRTRNAVRGAFMGFFVDMFDIYLPIVVLAPAMAYFISPSMPETTASIVGASIFGDARRPTLGGAHLRPGDQGHRLFGGRGEG
jgi:hypothetical protein